MAETLTATHDSIAKAFSSDKIPSVPLSWVYRFALTSTALAMVLLPLIYVGFIGAVAWGVWRWKEIALEMLENKIHFITLLIAVTPFLAGVVVIFFMLKPLLARRPRQAEGHILTPGENPLLEDYIKRVCHAVGAPAPRRIKITADVNAAAGSSGGLFHLLIKRLDLTIGLPIATLPLKSFGGIMAHEFGHFAQGGGMALSCVIRSINFWFARVVYERDAWDERLDEFSASVGDWRLQIPLQICRGAVWLSRKLLWVLMHIGHYISCFAMRQMEYNADACEAGFSGSKQFAETCREMTMLNLGNAHAMQIAQTAWLENRLPKSLPQLAHQRTLSLSQEEQQTAWSQVLETKTSLAATHPSDASRIQAANALNLEGIFSSDLPATVLFTNYESLCEECSVRFYKQEAGLDMAEAVIVDNAELSQKADTLRQENESLAKFFCNRISLSRLWVPICPDFDSPVPTTEAYHEMRVELSELSESLAASFEAFDREELKYFTAAKAWALLSAGFTLQPKEFGIAQGNVFSAESAMNEAKQAMAAHREKIKPFDELAWRALQMGCLISCAGDRDRQLEWEKLADAAAKLEPLFPHMETMRLAVARHQILLENSHISVPGLRSTAEKNTAQIQNALEGVAEITHSIPALFSNPSEHQTLASLVRKAHLQAAKSGHPMFVVKMIACEQILMELKLFTTKIWGRLAHLSTV